MGKSFILVLIDRKLKRDIYEIVSLSKTRKGTINRYTH